MPLAARAQATEPPIRATLAWSAPEGCGAAEDVERAVSAQLGRRAFVDGDEELRVRVSITREDRFVASVDLTTEAGEAVGHRVVASRSPTCDAITESVVVVLGVMLNVDRADLALPPPPPRLEAALYATGGLELGLLPLAAGEATLGFALGARDVVDVGLEAGWIATSSVPVAAGAWLVQAASARIAASLPLTHGEAELSLRIAIGGGAAWASVSSLDVDRSLAVAALVELRGGLRLLVHLAGVLWLTIVAEGAVLPLRPEFRVREMDGTTIAAFSSSIGAGSFALGPLVRFE